MNRKNIIAFFVFTLGCELVGIVSGLFTMNAISSGWYATLIKAPLNPPSWIFGPVWTALYFLMGCAAFLVWRKKMVGSEGDRAMRIFYVQLILNFAWSIFFFAFKAPLLAFVVILLLWMSILWTIILFSKISRVTVYLLIPYLLWVSFAAYLNYMIVVLN